MPAERCLTCRKKLDLTACPCRCGAKFCAAHRLPEEHACTFDYTAEGKRTLSTLMVAVVGPKMRDSI